MKKQKILIVTVLILVIILLIPFPSKLKDGGSTELKSVLYTVTKYKQISIDGYIRGWKIELLGMTVYDKKIPPELESQAQSQ